MYHNMHHTLYKKSYKTENIFFFNQVYSNVWQSQYVSSDSSIQSQIIVHKIPIQRVHHLHWCMPENGASLNSQECWTMLVECLFSPN